MINANLKNLNGKASRSLKTKHCSELKALIEKVWTLWGGQMEKAHCQPALHMGISPSVKWGCCVFIRGQPGFREGWRENTQARSPCHPRHEGWPPPDPSWPQSGLCPALSSASRNMSAPRLLNKTFSQCKRQFWFSQICRSFPPSDHACWTAHPAWLVGVNKE